MSEDVVERAKAALEWVGEHGVIDPLMQSTRELVAEIERLRKVTDIIDPDSVYREQRDQAWAERDAANAEVERLRAIVAGVRAELTNITDDKSYDRIAAVPGLLR